MNYFQNYGYANPYLNGNPIQQIQQPTRMDTQYTTYNTQQFMKPQQSIGLQGKSVDSVDVVKAMDIPLDGSISYFPLTDGTAIVTKQLQPDGTSKTIIYKPLENTEEVKQIKYITSDDLDEAMQKMNNDNLKEEIKTLKRQIKDINAHLKEIPINKDKEE